MRQWPWPSSSWPSSSTFNQAIRAAGSATKEVDWRADLRSSPGGTESIERVGHCNRTGGPPRAHKMKRCEYKRPTTAGRIKSLERTSCSLWNVLRKKVRDVAGDSLSKVATEAVQRKPTLCFTIQINCGCIASDGYTCASVAFHFQVQIP